MANSSIAIDEGTADKRAASYSFSEDAQTKEIQRVAMNNSLGAEIDWSAIITDLDNMASNMATMASDVGTQTDLFESWEEETTAAVAETAVATTNGMTNTLVVSAASTNSTNLKGSAGRIYDIDIGNAHASAHRYLKLYNKATAPTVGTDTPIKTILIPFGGGFTRHYPLGIYFSTGIGYALTTGAATADTGAVGAAEHVGGIGWI